MTYNVFTTSSEETLMLGAKLGQRLKGGEVIEMIGDIGAGKTTFTQGIARGLGYRGEVPSPTFTINRSYQIPKGIILQHFDFYRLEGRDIVTDELDEALSDPNNVTVIEWGEKGDAHLPAKRLTITIWPGEKDDYRAIEFRLPGDKLTYLIKGLV